MMEGWVSNDKIRLGSGHKSFRKSWFGLHFDSSQWDGVDRNCFESGWHSTMLEKKVVGIRKNKNGTKETMC